MSLLEFYEFYDDDKNMYRHVSGAHLTPLLLMEKHGKNNNVSAILCQFLPSLIY